MFNRQKGDRLHEHAGVRPLSMTHALVDDKHERDGRIEKLEVFRKPGKARKFVFARNAKGAIQVFAHCEPAGSMRLPKISRIDGAVCRVTFWRF